MATARRRAEQAQHQPADESGGPVITMSTAEYAELMSRIDGAAPQLDDDDSDAETATDRVARMLSNVDREGRAEVKVYKVIAPNKYAWASDYSVADFEVGGIKMIRDEWGAGEYQIRLYAQAPGSNHYGIRAKENVTILEPRTAPAAAAGASTELAQMLRAMQEGQERLIAALTQRPEPVDPALQFTQSLTMMKLMREAMGDGPKQASLAEQLALIQELRKVSQEFEPPAPAEPSLTAMLPGVLDLVRTGMSQRASLPPPIDGTPPPVLVAAPLSPPPNQAAQPQPEGDQMFDLLLMRKTLTKLTKLAADNGDEQEAADILCDALDMLEDQGSALGMLELPNWFAILQQVAPEVGPHEAWMTRVRDAALSAFDDGGAANDAKPTP